MKLILKFPGDRRKTYVDVVDVMVHPNGNPQGIYVSVKYLYKGMKAEIAHEYRQPEKIIITSADSDNTEKT